MPRKIRAFLQIYQKNGAIIVLNEGKGSHRKIKHAKLGQVVIVSGNPGDDAKAYQEKDLRSFLDQIHE